MSDAPAEVDARADRSQTPIHDHLHRAEQLSALARAQRGGQSRRAAAASAGVSRSTLRYWSAPKPTAAAAALAAFAETPEGVRCLRQILVAAHWCITEFGGRASAWWLNSLSTAACPPSSVLPMARTQQAFHAELAQQILACADAQREALAKAMPYRTMSVAEDETWQDGMRLVAIEPVSEFILIQQVAEERSAAGWTSALEHGLAGLNVTVVQGTSNEAKGLLAHVERALGAHHSTDLFHLQHAVSKATSLSLKRAEQEAEAEEAKAKARWQEACAAEQAYHRRRHGPGRPPAFAAHVDQAREKYVQASLAREQAQAQRTEAKALIGAFSEVDHPYDLEHAQAKTPQRLAERLGTLFKRLETFAEEADLSERLCAHLVKAKRLTHSLVATLAFLFMMMNARVQALNLAPAIEQAMLNDLIPVRYLERVAQRSTHAEQRHRLRALSARHLEALQQPAHERLRAGVADSQRVFTDDSGWRIDGEPAQMMAFETDAANVYQIRRQHRNEEVREVMPSDCGGIMHTDQERSYDAEALEMVAQQKCCFHRRTHQQRGGTRLAPGCDHTQGLALLEERPHP